MKIDNVYYHPRFKKLFLDLPEGIREKTKEQEKIFRANPFDTRLKTHKLHGKLKNLWSFSVSLQYRILFIFDNHDVIFLDVGTHEIYK